MTNFITKETHEKQNPDLEKLMESQINLIFTNKI